MINLLEMRNGHLCDLDKDCNKPTACENISILKSLSSVLLTIHPEEEFAALWHTVLQQLSQCLVDDDILNIYRRLTLSQAGGYRGGENLYLKPKIKQKQTIFLVGFPFIKTFRVINPEQPKYWIF